VIPEAIQGLLEKRRTFQGWLSRLDELGSEFRPAVAEKVRTDYAGRLAEVETELEGHRSELEAVLAERTEAAENVAEQHDARSAELEETQLRHAVGEFDDEEWERRRAEHQAGIDEIEAELTTQRSAVEALETVLAELAGTGPGLAEVVSVAPEAEAVEDQEAAGDETPAAESGDRADAWMTRPLDESEAEDAVEDVAAAEPADTTEAEEPEAAESEAEAPLDQGEPEEEFIDELEFLESLSLDDAENFDAVSAMLDEDGDSADDEGSDRKSEDS